ncbi:MAG: Holliday junction branch migration protein RuvA [bacterium]|nr:Holliday junction branch migration protein RuvA [bacterium]
MIGRLEGRPCEVQPGSVILDVHGIGYRVSTTLSAFDRLSTAERVVLRVHTVVKTDAIDLYGFFEEAELAAFERLISVAGVGPRTALAVLSALSPADLVTTIDAGNVSSLQRTPGVGRKTAERIILELKGHLTPGGVVEGNQSLDAVSALVNLGYRESDAVKAVELARAEGAGEDLAATLRIALQTLTR